MLQHFEGFIQHCYIHLKRLRERLAPTPTSLKVKSLINFCLCLRFYSERVVAHVQYPFQILINFDMK